MSGADGYDQYLADLDELDRQDALLRFRVLDAAVFVEHELIAVAAFFLGGSDGMKQELVERLIGSWGGMRAATDILRTAFKLYEWGSAETDEWFGQVSALLDLRHVMAHGTSESWQRNSPEVRDGKVGRQLRSRSRTGQLVLEWIVFEEAEETVGEGRAAALNLSRRVAELTRASGST